MNRRTQLTLNIQKQYDTRDPWIVPRSGPPVDKHVMDMFEIELVTNTGARLRHLFFEKVYDVQILEASVRQQVRAGDVFLMAIIQQAGKWRVWHMSPPYEEVRHD